MLKSQVTPRENDVLYIIYIYIYVEEPSDLSATVSKPLKGLKTILQDMPFEFP